MLPIVFLSILELGWTPAVGVMNYTNGYGAAYLGAFYLKTEFEVSLYGFYVSGKVRTFAEKNPKYPVEFVPGSIWYNAGAGWKNDWLQIGWNHECDHPIVTMFFHPGVVDWEAGWDEFFARVTLKLSP